MVGVPRCHKHHSILYYFIILQSINNIAFLLFVFCVLVDFDEKLCCLDVLGVEIGIILKYSNFIPISKIPITFQFGDAVDTFEDQWQN